MNTYVTLNEEERNGYHITKEQKKIWEIEIELLVVFMEVCDRNNLKYFAAHGTLLGAVRHQGFIPWDDDIDINMPRADFERLKLIAHREFNEPYFFQTFESDPNCFGGIGKLRTNQATGMDIQDVEQKCNKGLYIDIFPMDGITDNEHLRRKQSKKVEFYRGMLLAKVYGKNYHYLLQYEIAQWKKLKWLSKFFSAGYLYSKFEEWCQKYTLSDNAREGIISFITDYECCYWYKKDYEELVLLNFESIKIPAPKNYDRCLRIKWNDYNKFPPEGKRKSKHPDVIFDPNVSYKEYNCSKFQIRKDIFKKKIILFGAGNLATEFIKFYGKRSHIYKLVDNNEKIWGQNLFYLKIENPDVLDEYLNLSQYCLIITCMDFKSVEQQLKNKGWKDYKIYLPGKII